MNRVDGKMKVTGAAQFTADFKPQNTAYAVILQSTIAHGRIARMDIGKAESVDGVLGILTPRNAPKLPGAESRISVLQNSDIEYNNQPIGVVVAETREQAVHAAALIKVRYDFLPSKLDFQSGFVRGYPGSHNGEPGDLAFGNVDEGLSRAEVRIDQVYRTPIMHHNRMEPHATVAQWDGDRLTIYDTTQNISGHKQKLAAMFGLPAENVRVVSLCLGGGFGCKGEVWSHTVLAAMAARFVKRPVKLVLDRPQMFGPVGARPQTYQHLTLGAGRDGKLTAIRHEVLAHTSYIEDYLESSAFPTRVMYACPNVSTMHRLVQLNLGTPTYARAPGVATGTYAIEVAMDELAYAVHMDPLALRQANYAEVDPQSKLPFTGKHLNECYSQGAERFGWSKRNPEPGSMREESSGLRIGLGMATETYPANRRAASALVRMNPDGRVLVACGTHEIGGGTYSILAQLAAETLGVSVDRVDVQLGDTLQPEAPISAGSMTTASVAPAVLKAANQLKAKLQERIASPSSNPNDAVEAVAKVEPDETLKQRASAHSFGAVFAEVSVDPELGTVKVRRIVAVYDVGKVLNEKTARSQFVGGIIWGISLALHENTLVDTRTGRVANGNLSEYHVPVHADIGEIDVSVLNIPDTVFNPAGVRGIGEIGITGTAAAISNAVFHATGIRIRDLPITLDKLHSLSKSL